MNQHEVEKFRGSDWVSDRSHYRWAMASLIGSSGSDPYLVYRRPDTYAFDLSISKRWVWVPRDDSQPPSGYVVAEVLNDSNINAIKVRIKDSSDVCRLSRLPETV